MNNTELKKKLESELVECSWELLIPHYDRDAIILVSDELNIIDVGIAIANDDNKSVENWMSNALLKKPIKEEVKDFKKYNLEFEFLILAPYVLVQESQDSHYIIAVHQQMESNTPTEVKKTYDRLIKNKTSIKETLQLISSVLAFEIHNLKEENRDFDTELYSHNLKNLPNLPY